MKLNTQITKNSTIKNKPNRKHNSTVPKEYKRNQKITPNPQKKNMRRINKLNK